MRLWTGYTGLPVTAQSDRALYAGIVGLGGYALKVGELLEGSLIDANHLSIESGHVIFQGAHIELDGTEEWPIPTGAQGAKRSNIAGIKLVYEVSDNTITENAIPLVLSGEAVTSGDPVDPVFVPDSSSNKSEYFMPLYRVVTNGINALEPVKLFNVLVPASEAWDSISRIASNIIGIDADSDALRFSYMPAYGGNFRLIVNSDSIRLYDVNSKKYTKIIKFQSFDEW